MTERDEIPSRVVDGGDVVGVQAMPSGRRDREDRECELARLGLASAGEQRSEEERRTYLKPSVYSITSQRREMSGLSSACLFRRATPPARELVFRTSSFAPPSSSACSREAPCEASARTHPSQHPNPQQSRPIPIQHDSRTSPACSVREEADPEEKRRAGEEGQPGEGTWDFEHAGWDGVG